VDHSNSEKLIAAILGATVRRRSIHTEPRAARGGKGIGPSTTQGKWLALRLAYLRGASDPTPLDSGPRLFKAVGVSARQGPKGYQDLVACGWIVQNHFKPEVNPGPEKLIHFSAIQRILEYSHAAALELEERFEMGLKPDNRLLLLTLLLLASRGGRVDAVSDGDLAHLTGFTSTQVKGQMERLKQLGFVGGVIPGVTLPGEFGRAKSCIYLNLLHPWWAISYPGWRLIELHPSIWRPLLAVEPGIFRSVMRRASLSVLSEAVQWSAYAEQVRMYLRNLVLMQASESTQVFLAPSPSPEENDERVKKWISADLNDLVASILISLRDDHGYPISRVMAESGSMILYPAFGTAPLQIDPDLTKRSGPMLLTNIAMLKGGIDSTWLDERNCGEWVKRGVVTDGSLAPRKYGSRTATISESLAQYFWGINT
jgi:hypothetical protein